ncbi:hypothetical protein [Lysinibacillus sp. 54212]|uniref:hypothetical protein n=1 Tax=Lysinibacillus sp. 54212 TaxID=3119829 RepID=UPI002FC9B41B
MGAALQRPTYEKKRIFNVKREKTGWAWLKNYSKFVDSDDFDNNMEMILAEKKKRFSKVQLCILTVLRQFAVKFGVVNLTHREIIKKVHENYGHKVCAKTITNLTKKLESMGIVIVFPGQQSDFRYTSNVIVFNRYDEMRAYEIAQLKEKEEEIERLMMQDLVNASGAMNFAAKARQWAEEKARKEAEAEAAAKAAEEEAQKQKTLYAKMKAHLAAKKMNMSDLNTYASILYGFVKKAVESDSKLSKEQAEKIAWKAFLDVISKKDSDIKKNRVAMLSYTVKRRLNAILNPEAAYSDLEMKRKEAKAKGHYVEQVPKWFNKNENEVNHSEDINVEDEMARIVAKMGI